MLLRGRLTTRRKVLLVLLAVALLAVGWMGWAGMAAVRGVAFEDMDWDGDGTVTRIKVLGPVSEQQLLAAAFSPDSPQLRAAFDDYLRELKRDGRYDALVDHYYPGIRRYFPAFFAGYE